jgi:hypothetical protein
MLFDASSSAALQQAFEAHQLLGGHVRVPTHALSPLRVQGDLALMLPYYPVLNKAELIHEIDSRLALEHSKGIASKPIPVIELEPRSGGRHPYVEKSRGYFVPAQGGGWDPSDIASAAADIPLHCSNMSSRRTQRKEQNEGNAAKDVSVKDFGEMLVIQPRSKKCSKGSQALPPWPEMPPKLDAADFLVLLMKWLAEVAGDKKWEASPGLQKPTETPNETLFGMDAPPDPRLQEAFKMYSAALDCMIANKSRPSLVEVLKLIDRPTALLQDCFLYIGSTKQQMALGYFLVEQLTALSKVGVKDEPDSSKAMVLSMEQAPALLATQNAFDQQKEGQPLLTVLMVHRLNMISTFLRHGDLHAVGSASSMSTATGSCRLYMKIMTAQTNCKVVGTGSRESELFSVMSLILLLFFRCIPQICNPARW